MALKILKREEYKSLLMSYLWFCANDSLIFTLNFLYPSYLPYAFETNLLSLFLSKTCFSNHFWENTFPMILKGCEIFDF